MKNSKKITAKKIIAIIIALAVCAGTGVYLHRRHAENSRPREYDTAEIRRETVERIIVSTGTIEPVSSVEVGTQVSGTVDRVLADFNDTVQAGQVIAEIDRSVLMSKLTEARASHMRAQALFTQSEQEFRRGGLLYEQGLISEQDFVRAQTDYQSQRASLQVAQAAVNTASENVRYATIRSPVRGTVISRNVEVGQTVAASLSAPTLFIIAEDLKRMKIMAQVDETDIGRIRAGQQVRFSVQAYPDKRYSGEVNQVRLQPEILQNVVTYTVVVIADNDDGTLLPGMTANVEFIEARVEDALTVPMSALRFNPPDDVVARFAEERKAKMTRERERDDRGGDDRSDRRADRPTNEPSQRPTKDISTGERLSSNRPANERPANDRSSTDRSAGDRPTRERPASGDRGGRRAATTEGGRGVLWTLDENREFVPVYVRIGLNDGVRVVVTGDENLREGLRVVTGESRPAQSGAQQNRQNRSILPEQQRGGPRRM